MLFKRADTSTYDVLMLSPKQSDQRVEVSRGLDAILRDGDQNGILDRMQHRKDLYDLLRYEDYNRFDKALFNFEVGDTPME